MSIVTIIYTYGYISIHVAKIGNWILLQGPWKVFEFYFTKRAGNRDYSSS